MSDLFEEPADNAAEFTVSELSGAVKRVIEGEFGQVRVRGEVGRVSRPSSGHLYYDLKDDRSVIAAITWKGQASKLTVRPEEGMEVIATGRMTTFPGQSKYQLIIDDIRPAGAGALMAMLEKRRLALAAEGLFDADRKRPLPWLPQVIGVVTSPSGSVIRDILHRLRDRFPRHVLIWPVAVQGERCAPEVAAAIRGFNALPKDGPIPRPDLLIVARGGGSLEDLWGFNEEVVVRAAAESQIPLISAVGHETDTTLIDHASDRRAPTPTAAAEMAVPVRVELLAALDQRGASLSRCVAMGFVNRAQRLRDLSRALPRPETLTQTAAQRHDLWAGRLDGALGMGVSQRRARLDTLAAHLRPRLLADLAARGRERLADRTRALGAAAQRRQERGAERLANLSARLAPAYARALGEAARDVTRNRDRLAGLQGRLDASLRLKALADRLEATDRLRQTLGYRETLARGYAVVRGDGEVVTTRAAAERAHVLEVEFDDGRLTLGGKPKRSRKEPPTQGSLF